MRFLKNTENLKKLDEAFRTIQLPDGMNYQLPPNSFKMLNGEFLDYQPKTELLTQFRIAREFSNPQGTVQGGIIAAAFDDTFGPIGVATSQKPILTIDMNLQFVRPVPLEEHFYIVTRIVSVSRTTLFIRADGYSHKGKLLAQASSNQIIIR